jgi:hypothetical protein
MKSSLRSISPLVGYTKQSNLLPFRPLLLYPLKLDRALREFISLSIGMCSHLGHSEFKLVVLIDDSDSVSLKQLLATDLLKLYFSLLKMDGGLWLQARDSLAGVAEYSRQNGGESIDIYCLNNPKYSLDLRVGSLVFLVSNANLIG